MDKVVFKAGKLYTLTEILRIINGDYFLDIERTILKLPWNKKIIDTAITEYRLQKIFDRITEHEYFFRNIFDVYSVDVSIFKLVVSLGGTVDAAVLLGVPELKEDIGKYLSRNLLFAIPSPESPLFYAVPAEFIILSSSRSPSYRYDYEPDYLPSCLSGYDLDLLNVISNNTGVKNPTKDLLGISRIYASIANNFEDMLLSLSNSERDLLTKIYNQLGVVSYIKLLDSRDRYPGIPTSTFIDLLRSNGYRDQISLIEKGITCLTCSNRGTTTGIVVISMEFIRKVRSYLGLELTDTSKVCEGTFQRFEQPYEKAVSILLATEFMEREGKKHDATKTAQVTHISKQTIEIVLTVAHDMQWVDGPRTHYRLTGEGKTIIDWSESSKTKFLNVIQNAYRIIENTEYKTNLRVPIGGFYPIIDKMLERQHIIKVSEIIDLVLEDPSVFEQCRKTVINVNRQSWYHSNNEYEKDILNSPQDFFYSLYKEAIFEYLQALYIAGRINISSEDITLDTCIQRNKNSDLSFKSIGVIKETFEMKTNSKISLLPNYEMLIDPHLPIRDIMYIAELSDLISIDQVIVARITKASLVRFLNTFGNSSDIIPRLEKLCGGPLPQNIVRLIKDVGEKENEVSLISSQYILSTKDSSIINDLAKNKELSKYIGKRITENEVVIKQGISRDKLISTIRKRGYVVHAEKVEEEAEYQKRNRKRKYY